MVYFSRVLDVITNQLKIGRIYARNVHRIHGHKRLDNDASLYLSISRSRKVTVLCSRCAGAPFCLYTKKLVLGQPVHVWQWPLRKKVVAKVCLLHFDTKSEQSDCNTSSVG